MKRSTNPRARVALALGALALSNWSCSSDPLAGLTPGAGPAVADADLFTLAKIGPTWTFYKRNSTPIERSSRPHPETHALVRYNSRAATQLDAAGKVKSGASFPDSSIIVKELSNAIRNSQLVNVQARHSHIGRESPRAAGPARVAGVVRAARRGL